MIFTEFIGRACLRAIYAASLTTQGYASPMRTRYVPRISLRIHCIDMLPGASPSHGSHEASSILMPPVFSAQAAGIKWHSRSSRAFSTACDGSQSGSFFVWACTSSTSLNRVAMLHRSNTTPALQCGCPSWFEQDWRR